MLVFIFMKNHYKLIKKKQRIWNKIDKVNIYIKLFYLVDNFNIMRNIFCNNI